MGASLSFKDTVQGALWRLQNNSAPCTSNACQFQQEFLKAQLRRAKGQLKALEYVSDTARFLFLTGNNVKQSRWKLLPDTHLRQQWHHKARDDIWT